MKLGCRYYDPIIGRFITKDPARSGLNWYAYCGKNPVNGVDPTGDESWLSSGTNALEDDFWNPGGLGCFFGGSPGDIGDTATYYGEGMTTGAVAVGSIFAPNWVDYSWNRQPGFDVSKGLGYVGVGAGVSGRAILHQ